MSVILPLSDSAIGSGTLLGLPLPDSTTHVLLCKGATEAIMGHCTHIVHVSRDNEKALELAPISPDHGKSVDQQGAQMASESMRVLALAIRFLNDAEVEHLRHPETQPKEAENKLAFVGLIGSLDPPREEVPAAIERCHAAGIRVCMITGDHALTAIAVARSIGIYQDGVSETLKGIELDALTMEQLAAYEPFPTVFSRVSPDNKLKIVRALQRRGDVVAMTGDGVNDAPAIKQADVGIAMGRAGTQIAKQVHTALQCDLPVLIAHFI